MNFGRILQLGTPREVYYRPRAEFVARFFGDNNLIEGVLGPGDARQRRIDTPLGPLQCAVDGQADVAGAPAGARAFAVFRPESVVPAAVGSGGAEENRASGTVADVSFAGATTVAVIDLEGKAGPVAARLKIPSRVDGIALAPGDRLTISWPALECRLVLA
jgi:spermidine/putrescine transport system ATP-binding protein